MDDGHDIFLWVSKVASPSLLSNVFGVSSADHIDSLSFVRILLSLSLSLFPSLTSSFNFPFFVLPSFFPLPALEMVIDYRFCQLSFRII